MSLTAIKSAYTTAATAAGFATNNIYFSFDWAFNEKRGSSRYPAIMAVPPKIAAVPSKKEYKTTLTVYVADYPATVTEGTPPNTTTRDEYETETWDRLTGLAYLFVSSLNSASNYVYVNSDKPEIMPLSKGGAGIDNVLSIMLTLPIVVVKC